MSLHLLESIFFLCDKKKRKKKVGSECEPLVIYQNQMFFYFFTVVYSVAQ